MRKTTKPASIQAAVTNEVKDRFDKAAADEEMSTSTLARRIIIEWLDNQEGVEK